MHFNPIAAIVGVLLILAVAALAFRMGYQRAKHTAQIVFANALSDLPVEIVAAKIDHAKHCANCGPELERATQQMADLRAAFTAHGMKTPHEIDAEDADDKRKTCLYL